MLTIKCWWRLIDPNTLVIEGTQLGNLTLDVEALDLSKKKKGRVDVTYDGKQIGLKFEDGFRVSSIERFAQAKFTQAYPWCLISPNKIAVKTPGSYLIFELPEGAEVKQKKGWARVIHEGERIALEFIGFTCHGPIQLRRVVSNSPTPPRSEQH